MNKIAAFSITGIGVVSVVGFGIYTFVKDRYFTPFFQRINTKKRVILETSDSTHDSIWAEIVKKYEKNGNVRGISKVGNVQENLKQYCQSNRSSTSSRKEEFEQYRNYCTRENLMTKISSIGRTWNTSNDTSKWTGAEITYKGSENTGDDLLISKDNVNISKENITKEDIMEHCKSISTKPFINKVSLDYKRGYKLCTVTNG